MEALFIRVFNISITASYLILTVIMLRLILKKTPKWIVCFLWIMVGVRLVFPFSFKSIFSLIPSTETLPQSIIYNSQPRINSGIPVLNQAVNPVISGSMIPAAGSGVTPVMSLVRLAADVWIIGMCVLLLYAIISYTRLCFKLRMAVRLEDNIWQCERVDSPFVLGIVRPRVYIPYNMEKGNQECVIAHERAHIKRKDHLIKPFSFILLAVYWFNPLVWLSYVLLCKDIELACDERVIKNMDIQKRKVYSASLLSCSTRRKAIAACPVAFGEVGIKERIKGVLNYKKPSFYIIAAALFSCLAVGMCFLTNPKDYEKGVAVSEELDKAVSQAVLERDEYKHSQYETEAHTIFKVEESESRVEVYTLVMKAGFNFSEDEIIQDTGSHIPTALTFEKKEDGKYKLLEYWIPMDGTSYASSIRSKFPGDVADEAMDTQKYVYSHATCCYEQAMESGMVDPDKVLSKLIDKICSSPSTSSNPGDYIRSHDIEYRELVWCGNSTLSYCFRQFEKGSQRGLEGHIMALACQDIMVNKGEKIEKYSYETGQDWYDKFKKNAH